MKRNVYLLIACALASLVFSTAIADAGTLSGGAYTLSGGFWFDFLGNKLNLPLILR